MKLLLDLRATVEDSYAVPQCQALALGRYHYRWEPRHQCPFRGRYRRQGTSLCGCHVNVIELDLVSDVITPIRRRA